jgi:hypothetical protein
VERAIEYGFDKPIQVIAPTDVATLLNGANFLLRELLPKGAGEGEHGRLFPGDQCIKARSKQS